MKPERRRDGLVVKELPDEILVYDLERHKAHCLNPAAAAVFKSCNGDRTVADLARILRRELGAPADEAWVYLALARLGRARLLEERVSAPRALGGITRRQLLKKAGVGMAAALPLVTSIVAPTPASAAATCIQCCSVAGSDGKPCGNPIALCTGFCTCSGGFCLGGCGADC
jgi:Coenzyme PQQ synthesis protein D (PqqD)